MLLFFFEILGLSFKFKKMLYKIKYRFYFFTSNLLYLRGQFKDNCLSQIKIYASFGLSYFPEISYLF